MSSYHPGSQCHANTSVILKERADAVQRMLHSHMECHVLAGSRAVAVRGLLSKWHDGTE